MMIFQIFAQFIFLDLPVATLISTVSIDSILKHSLLSQKNILTPLSGEFTDQSICTVHIIEIFQVIFFVTCGSLKPTIRILISLINV